MSLSPDKRHIAASFSRAAASYDQVAELQRSVAQQLLFDTLEPLLAAKQIQCWLDLGSGTGYGSRALYGLLPQATGMALDLSEGMLKYAQPLGGAEYFIGGDAEHLPLQAGCCDLIFSSLALQWCGNFPQVLAEAYRVLRPGGVLAFSSLCAGTLHELQSSWRQVDALVHVNRFRTLTEYQRSCANSDFKVLHLELEPRRLYYPDLRHLTHELKNLGAHNVNPGRPEGLTGRARIQALVAAYEGLRTSQGLPACWEVLYAVLEKSEPS